MGRKDFLADFGSLKEAVAANDELKCISINKGADDGQVDFRLKAPTGKPFVSATALCSDLSLYPTKNPEWVIFAEECDDLNACSALEGLSPSGHNLTAVADMVIQALAVAFQITLPRVTPSLSGTVNAAPAREASNDDEEAGTQETDVDEEPMYPMYPDTDDEDGGVAVDTFAHGPADAATKVLVARDVVQTRLHFPHTHYFSYSADEGFYLVSYVQVQWLVDQGFLGADACEAWGLDLCKYLSILGHFNPSYVHIPRHGEHSGVLGMDHTHGKPEPHASFRVLLSGSPKLDGQAVREAFRGATANSREEGAGALEPFLLSWSLADLLSTRLLQLLHLRLLYSLGWRGAEQLVTARRADSTYMTGSKLAEHREALADLDDRARGALEMARGQAVMEVEELDASAIPVGEGDGSWVKDVPDRYNAWLLVVRYVVRRMGQAGKFCLVCHERVTGDIEPLKPFVCTSPLCTYQYIQMGLGPSIELEIVNNPRVVDMLVSFAYMAATSAGSPQTYQTYGYGRNVSIGMDPFPDGLEGEKTLQFKGSGQITWWDKNANVIVGEGTRWMSGEDTPRGQRLSPGDKLSFVHQGTTYTVTVGSISTDAKVILSPMTREPKVPLDVTGVRLDYTISRTIKYGFPAVAHFSPATANTQTSVTGAQNLAAPAVDSATVQATKDKNDRVRIALDKLPRLYDLVLYLVKHGMTGGPATELFLSENVPPEPEADEIQEDEMMEDAAPPPPIEEPPANVQSQLRTTTPSLKGMLDDIDLLLYPLLRWIIASNRAYFRELTDPAELLAGISDKYIQFKMVMGSLEKEEQFVKEWSMVGKTPQSIYAYHGSPLRNWHSIIRTGLHFNNVLHGRAFGNGIYHSHQLGTSQGYANINYQSSFWPNSSLKIAHVMSLNEIVNAPDKFVSVTPHLVVGTTSWVQTRYLLLRVTDQERSGKARPRVEGVRYLQQDAKYYPTAEASNISVQIPERHVTRFASSELLNETLPPSLFDELHSLRISEPVNRPLKRLHSNDDEVHVVSSDDEEEEEEDYYGGEGYSDDDIEINVHDPKRPKISSEKNDEGDTLEQLALMDPPEYASPTATKALQKELMRIKRTMEETPERDRGWRLDMSDIRNLYQWVVHIVEFDPSLPLAKDLAKFNLSNEGVTLEVRFSPEYPIAPPYIRVVKPRMLQHIEGGGGHVTAGGSICMDLLTTSGWLPSYTIESALLQVRMALTAPHPPARVHPTRWRESYSPFEAMEAYVRVAGMHGWAVPANWRTYFGK